jgi:hypothetical protein
MTRTPWVKYSKSMNGFLCEHCSGSYALGPNDDFQACAQAFMIKHANCSSLGQGFTLIENNEPLPVPVIMSELLEPTVKTVNYSVPDARFYKVGQMARITVGDERGYVLVMSIDLDRNVLVIRDATKAEVFFYVKVKAFFIRLQVLMLSALNKLLKTEQKKEQTTGEGNVSKDSL